MIYKCLSVCHFYYTSTLHCFRDIRHWRTSCLQIYDRGHSPC